ncbi:MAG: DUF3604 domain-containing protein [Gammaproteobacteria bacterium]|nr:DUF3604 domain-containing protein [Gammaproteobacteria bacterium]
MNKLLRITIFAISILSLEACSDQGTPSIGAETEMLASDSEETAALAERSYSENREACADYSPQRKPLFGELHIHTALSFDAAAGRLKTLPADAYRFAKGETIPYFPVDENGNVQGEIRIDRPLDFVAITDHGEFLGETVLCKEKDSPAYDGDFCKEYRKVEFRGAAMIATSMSGDYPERIKMLCGEDGQLCRDYAEGPWQVIRQAAEDAYDRSTACKFTSFVGYEYTGSPNNSNYHRNVIFRNDNVPDLPVSYMENPYDYLLWEQLDNVCKGKSGCDYLTIPHNSNISNNRLLTPYANLEPTLENKVKYAKDRQKNEPIMEIFQHKGGSECLNGLKTIIGAPDELCNIEQVRQIGSRAKRINISLDGPELVFDVEDSAAETVECEGNDVGRHGMMGGGCVSKNDFLRSALLTGMLEEQDIGINPIKLGVIAASDGHTSTPGSVKENQWQGYVTGEMTPEERLQPGTLPSGILGNPGGLAGVWAEENSRDAIFNAMQRREVFGTSGPRILPRFFAGWEFETANCDRQDMIADAYQRGVPMGADLTSAPSQQSKPTFLVSALRDSATDATPLQQLQIIKGWVSKEGESRYEVHTVAGDADNGAGVNLGDGSRFGNGHDALCTVFKDESFDPAVPSYYYLRVVENPSPRWSLLDCLKMNESKRPAICEDKSRQVIQEMAWTSPIWYTPVGK